MGFGSMQWEQTEVNTRCAGKDQLQMPCNALFEVEDQLPPCGGRAALNVCRPGLPGKGATCSWAACSSQVKMPT
eukprot:397187-Karenia_brevis.AAC.1